MISKTDFEEFKESLNLVYKDDKYPEESYNHDEYFLAKCYPELLEIFPTLP